MRKSLFLSGMTALMFVMTADAQRKTCIDSDWKFMLGNGNQALVNPSAADSWRTLSLPHDWSVEPEAAAAAGGQVIGPFSTNSVGKFQTGFTVGGEGWYAKTVHLTKEDLQGRVELYFEGAYNQSRVYVNGKQGNYNVYGYSSFKFDATSLLKEGDNSIVVKVENNGNNTRWYAGSGIYRHVWLVKTAKLYAEEWDTFVRTEDNKKVIVTTTLNNKASLTADATLSVTILDANGNKVAAADAPSVSVRGKNMKEVTVETEVNNANTWSTENPYLYQAVISVKDKDGNTADTFTKNFGFRTLSFSATEGFKLNGVPTLLKGGCVHHDNGLLGAAAFDEAELRKLKLLKQQGYNAVRCSHNLPSENFLNVCDELGLMVIDECFDQWLFEKNRDDYHNYFEQHSDEDLAVMMRRDRNHPSIIMWSIGNEIPGRIEPAGMAAAARLRAGVLKYDTTRPVTAAICGWDAGDAWNSAAGNWDAQCEKAFQSLDVGGYNYLFGKYEPDHAADPNRVMCGLESFPKQASENWDLVERLPYVIGDFVWTAMDYLGEAGIGCALEDRQPNMFQDWPYFNGWCGDIDLIGQKKPQSYYRDVVWREKPVTMAVQATSSYNNAWGWQLEEQSWTWPGREGQNVSVNVYSRAPKVRLYLNGQNVGEAVPGGTYWAGFNVAYQPGTLRVVNLDANGNELTDQFFELATTGTAKGVNLVYEDKELTADGNDLAYVTIELVDENGKVVTSDCTTQIEIRNEGSGELIACGTASPNDMKSFRNNRLTVFRGRALAIVRSNGTAGPVKIAADIIEKETTFTSFFFQNEDFSEESLNGWIISDGQYIKYNAGDWKSTDLKGFLEAYVGWGTAQTLAGQTVSQSTKVLPAGSYKLSFDYNATVRQGNQPYSSTGEIEDVTASVAGETLPLTAIGAEDAKRTSISFTIEEPKAVTFMLQFGENTNADWFAFDNLTVEYEGDFNFESDYLDCSSAVAVDGNHWPKVSDNASGGYIESKLGSAVYNQSGLAFWNATPLTSRNFFQQEVSGLEEGTYGLSAFVAANRWSGSDNDRDHHDGTFLFARTDGGEEVTSQVETDTYGLYSLVFNVKEGEIVVVGLKADENNGNNWCYLAQPHLVKLTATQPNAIDRLDGAESGTRLDSSLRYDLSGRPVLHQPAAKTIYIQGGKKYYSK